MHSKEIMQYDYNQHKKNTLCNGHNDSPIERNSGICTIYVVSTDIPIIIGIDKWFNYKNPYR